MINQIHAGPLPKNHAALAKGWKLMALTLVSWAITIGLFAMACNILKAMHLA